MNTALKEQVAESQGRKCKLSNKPLAKDSALYDAKRKTARRKGGKLEMENVIAVTPVANMAAYGNLRVRDVDLETLKSMVDDRTQIMRFAIKLGNQILAYKRQTDHLNNDTVDWLETHLEATKKLLGQKDRDLGKFVSNMNNSVAKAAMSVHGIGPVTVAHCLCYLDPAKADHASSFWKYAGLHCASSERYVKGEAGGGNKKLRTILYTMADSQIKSRGPYRVVYDNVKNRLEHSEKICKTRNPQGRLVECAWKDASPGHRHGAAIRATMKHFLADWWWVSRTVAGLPTNPLYPEAILDGGHKTIMPEERGWKY